MRSSQIRVIFGVLVIVIGAAVYTLVIGDVGLIVQQRMAQRLNQLEFHVASLERENTILQDRYLQFQKDSEQVFKEDIKNREIIILKFKMPFSAEQRAENIKQAQEAERQITLAEARILYIAGYIFFSLLCFVILEQIVKRNKNG